METLNSHMQHSFVQLAFRQNVFFCFACLLLPSHSGVKLMEKSALLSQKLGLFGMLKLALALQFIVTNAYFSVACNTKVSVRATLK